MTPLTRLYARYLPIPLVLPTVALTYAIALALVVFFGLPPGDDIVYVDVG